MKSTLTKIALSSALLLSSSLVASDIEVKITNLTKGISFTPLLVSAHNASVKLFMGGTPASANLKAMAEGGDISGLVSDLNATNADIVQDPAAGLLAAGATTTAELNTTTGNDYLSVVAMMLPTNDGFIGLNGIKIPTTAGTYRYTLNAYDAGTEANDELASHIPALATGSGATGINTTAEGFVHIHRGNIGDFDSTGGVSDLNAQTDRFLNPVASVVITVK